MPSNRKIVCVGFKTSEEVAERLKELAEQNGTTVSDLCRRIIESYLERKPLITKWTVLNGDFLRALRETGGLRIVIERRREK